ncbi:MAG: hypothetical protein C4522_18470 [Desulfobacteraceae bacterium]|nr:MAG: hypothetical protein C4522_18470 [Desulfobacteraceae bacterium]
MQMNNCFFNIRWIPVILPALILLFTGCSTSHEVIKYESRMNNSDLNLIPGLEPEEASQKILISVRGQGIEPETGTPQQKKLMAERAAVVDGYRKISERVAGMIIKAYSAAGYNNISEDQVTSETNAYLRGAQVNSVSFKDGVADATVKIYMAPREFKFYNGSIFSRGLLGSMGGGSAGAAGR